MYFVNNKSGYRGNTTLTLIFVMSIALLFAIIVGVQLGSGDYYKASIWLVTGLVLLYITHLHHYTWQLVLLSVFLGFYYYPLGFAIDAQHIGMVLGAGLAAFYILSPIRIRPRQQLRGTGIRGMTILLALWVAYLLAHMFWNHVDPYLSSQYSVKNAVKSYVIALSGPIILLWFIVKPSGFRVGKDWAGTVTKLLAFGLAVNIAIRIYFMSMGIGVDLPGAFGAGSVAAQSAGALVIPVINASPGNYTLRGLGPLAVLLGLLLLTSRSWFPRQSAGMKLLVLLTIFGGGIGALLGGGRASVLIAGFYIVVVAIIRRRYILLMGLGIAAVSFVTLVNVFSAAINEKAPFVVQRTLQYVMLDKGAAMESIESSTRWRTELAQRAIGEWLSDSRITLFGRATYAYNEGDILLQSQLGGYEAGLQSSLRRGTTHRLITDCLLQYGLVGTVIFYGVLLSILRFLYKLHRSQQMQGSEYRELTFTLLTLSSLDFALSFIASASWIPAQVTWLLLVLIIGYSAESRSEQVAAAKLTPKPELGRGSLNMPLRRA